MSDPRTPQQSADDSQVSADASQVSADASQVSALESAVSSQDASLSLASVLSVLANLSESGAMLAGEIKALRTAQTKQRRFGRLLAASVALDVILSVGLGGVAYRQNELGQVNRRLIEIIGRNASASVVACEASNQAIKNQKALWQPIIDSSPPPSTPEQAEQTRKFQGILDTPLADCGRT